jgi:hypothetical protein
MSNPFGAWQDTGIPRIDFEEIVRVGVNNTAFVMEVIED